VKDSDKIGFGGVCLKAKKNQSYRRIRSRQCHKRHGPLNGDGSTDARVGAPRRRPNFQNDEYNKFI